MKIILDFETYSKANLKKVGAVKYSEHPSTDIICMSYGPPEGPVATWIPGMPFPHWLVENVLYAHGAGFERTIWRNVGQRLYGFPEAVLERWRCTMASCAYKALPLRLEKAAEVLRLRHQKDVEGHRIMQRMAKPSRQGCRPDDFDLSQRTYNYCVDDVLAETELLNRVGDLPAPELEVWRLDQEINDRGIRIDQDAVSAAIAIAGQVTEDLTDQLFRLTGGAITGAGQVARIVEFCDQHGHWIPDLKKQTVTDALATDAPDTVVRRVLRIRQTLGRSSVKKYVAMRDCVCDDGRTHGLLQYHGAGTGRWAGRLIQPQNFPRGDYKGEPQDLVDTIMLRDPNLLQMIYGDPMKALSNALRPMLIAGPRRVFVAGDYSSIEARVLMRLAGQWDAVRMFAEGKDIYVALAEEIYGRTIDKNQDPEERQIGKMGVLGCGYQMAWRTFQEQALADFGVIISDELAQRVVRAYRRKYACVPALWKGLEMASMSAVVHGVRRVYRDIEYEVRGEWLSCRLPSGRRLWYHNPRVKTAEMPWIDERTGEPATRLSLLYDTWKEGRWQTVKAFGGLQAENVVSGTARDIMVGGMLGCKRAGYPLVLTNHDEIVTEPLEKDADPHQLEEIMETPLAWAKDYPIAAEAWVGERYRK